MPGVYKRKTERAKGKDGSWSCWWIGDDGQRKTCPGTSNREESKRLAAELDHKSRQVRLGLIDPAEARRRDEGTRPIADHVHDYRADLEAREDTDQHVKNTISAITRLLKGSGVEFIGDISLDKIRGGIRKIKDAGRSARTSNHALGAVKSFVRWLAASDRIKEYPASLAKIKPLPKNSDRRRIRKPLTVDEIERLIATTEKAVDCVTSWTARHGKPLTTMSGTDRAMAYRVAMATGFRAEEIRTLVPERFSLDGDNPTITVKACYSKRGKRSGRDDVQPIRKDFAALVAGWLSGRPTGVRVFPLPIYDAADMLRDDLIAAGIEPGEPMTGVVDFHALRHSYVTNLIRSGVNPKIVQILARHSSITLTLDTYTTLGDDEVRAALDQNPGLASTADPSGSARVAERESR